MLERQIKGRRARGVASLSAIFAAVFAGINVRSSSADVTYNTAGTSGATTSLNPTITAGDALSASTVTRTGLTANSGSNVYASTGNRFNSNAFDLTVQYVGYTVTPNAGSLVYISQATVTSTGSGTSPNQVVLGLATSATDFSDSTKFQYATAAITASNTTDTLTLAPRLLSDSTVSVRAQAYGTTGVSGSSATGGSWRVITPVLSETTPALSANIALAAATDLFIGAGNSRNLSGQITGSGNLRKVGGGLVQTSGATSYTGTTSVALGTLLVNATHTGGDNYTVAAGATLGGTGSINLASGKTISVASTGIISPGDTTAASSIGDLTGTAFTLNSGSIYRAEIDATTSTVGVDSLINRSGTVTITGATLTLVSLNSAYFTTGAGKGAAGLTYTLLDNQTTPAGNSIVGTFSGLAEGASISIANTQLKISYVGGDGNDITLTTVPEPVTLGVLAAGLLFRRRRA